MEVTFIPITTVLFDLDGTLLLMDQDAFVKAYFGRMAAKLAPHGYEPKLLIDTIWQGTAAMVKNDGSKSNEAVFWERAVALCGQRIARELGMEVFLLTPCLINKDGADISVYPHGSFEELAAFLDRL